MRNVNSPYSLPQGNAMKAFQFLIVIVILGALALLALGSSYRTVQPGYMGVKISLGKASPEPLEPGFYFLAPGVSHIERVNVQTQSYNFHTACFSSDLQTINANLTVIYRNKPEQVVALFTKYQGDILESLLKPNAQEALKQVTALETAEAIVQKREQVKNQALEILRKKMEAYNIATIDDMVIVNIDLSPELEQAIEAKMVQQQKAAQALYAQDQAKIDAATTLIRAEGEAKALVVRGEAIRQSPETILLNLVEKWDGKAPTTLVLGGNASLPSMLLNGAAESVPAKK